MQEFLEYEYSVEHSKKDKRLRRKKTLLMIGYILYCTVGISLAAFSKIQVLVAPLIALVPVTCWMISFFTWRYVCPEYKYRTVSGQLEFYTIYGNKTTKKIFEMHIADAEEIAPYTENTAADIEKLKPDNTYFGVSDLTSPDAYYMLFTDEDSRRCVYYFEATSKSLKILSFYNKKTVVTKVRY